MGKTNRREGGEGVLVGMSAGAMIATGFAGALFTLPITVEIPPDPPEIREVVHVTQAVAQEMAPETPQESAVEEKQPELMLLPIRDPDEALEAKMRAYATKYGVPYEDVHGIVACETGNTFDPGIQSFVAVPAGPNGREDSWGLAQIHLPSHPNITRAQATDPDFALDFLASHLAKGNHWMWACWKLI